VLEVKVCSKYNEITIFVEKTREYLFPVVKTEKYDEGTVKKIWWKGQRYGLAAFIGGFLGVFF
jgi:hypothetical protein